MSVASASLAFDALRRHWKKVAGWIFVAVAIFLPCRHMWPIGGSFYVDWPNHEWLIGYFGEYFRNNHTMPSVINTPGLGGLSHPVFYGNLYLPLLGLPSSVLAPGVVLRLAGILVFVLQYRLVSKALLRLDVPLYLARIVGCLVIWAVYPLTNFYNRSAMTEFFATTLLFCALAALVLLCQTNDVRERRLYASGSLLALTIAAGTHPITAMFGGPVFAALVPVFWWTLRTDRPRRRAILRALAPWAGVAIVSVLPWYLASRQYAEEVLVRKTAADVSILSWDTPMSRFYPIPWDSRIAAGSAPGSVNTPYLDAQISWSLLAVFVALGVVAVIAARRRSRAPLVAFMVGAGFFGVFTWLSLSATPYRALPGIAVMIQYVFRAVTYVNLSLLLGVFLLAMSIRAVAGIDVARALRHRAVIAVALAAFVLAAVGVFIKWKHIAAIEQRKSSPHVILNGAERRALIDVPAEFYGLWDYTTNRLFQPAVAAGEESKILPQNFPVDSKKQFGRTRTKTVELAAPTWVMTNVTAFPWNQLMIDGTPVSASDTRANWGKLTVMVPAGTHKLATRFHPPLWWRILRPLSVILVYAWCLFMLVYAAMITVRQRRLGQHGDDPVVSGSDLR